MSDFSSALPIRSELTGQAVYEDIIIKLGDATNPTTQQAAVDVNGSQFSVLKDSSGNLIGDQLLSATYWLQVVDPSNGPVAPGTAAGFSTLTGGVFHTTPPTLTNNQQAALQLSAAGRLLVDANVTLTYDTNYGTVGAGTLRSASQIGNATGAADFNYGTVGAQTLRTGAQIGNATGAADFNAGATGAQTLRVAANQGAPNTAANGWPVKPTDGTNSQSFTAAGEAKVDVTSSFEDQNYGTVGATTLRTAAQIGNATGAANFGNGATGAQTLRVAANLAVAGADVSGTNPVPVSITSTLVGTSVNNYNTAAAIAASATSNHVYTITAAKTFNGKKIWASASGALKIEVQISPDGSTYSTLWVGFNSSATPNISIDLDELVFLESGTGATVRIIRTNEDRKSMDIYSTISGTEV